MNNRLNHGITPCFLARETQLFDGCCGAPLVEESFSHPWPSITFALAESSRGQFCGDGAQLSPDGPQLRLVSVSPWLPVPPKGDHSWTRFLRKLDPAGSSKQRCRPSFLEGKDGDTLAF